MIADSFSRPRACVKERRKRILLVPDSIHWVSGAIAREIETYNPQYAFTICSEYVLVRARKRFEHLVRAFDAVHFLTPEPAARLCSLFPEDVARLTTVYHVEPGGWADELAGYDGIMTIADAWTEDLVERGIAREEIVKVPLGTDTEAFRPPGPGEREAVRRSLDLPQDAFVVGFCAKRSSDTFGRKGIDVFVDAFARLKTVCPKLAGLVIGPDWEAFAREQRAAGTPFAHQPFRIDPHDVARAYRALDVLWVTSRIEGGPAPLLEAMATGIPCVTTPVGHAPEVVTGNNGLLVPFDDARAFCDRSAEFARDPERRIEFGHAARRTMVDTRRWACTAPAAGALYASALDAAARRAPAGAVEARASGSAPLPDRLRSWMLAREHHLFARYLARIGELGPAVQLARLGVRTNPLDPALWWHAAVLHVRRALRPARGS